MIDGGPCLSRIDGKPTHLTADEPDLGQSPQGEGNEEGEGPSHKCGRAVAASLKAKTMNCLKEGDERDEEDSLGSGEKGKCKHKSKESSRKRAGAFVLAEENPES
jgi:hypothetical protein